MKFGWWVFIGLMGLGAGGGWAVHSVRQPSASTPAASTSRFARPKDHSELVARPIARKKRVGGLDVTFLVAADTHIGFDTPEDPGRDPLIDPVGIERTNLAMVETMNSIAGQSYPNALGGQVGAPRGVLIAGDLTEEGGREQWRLWTRIFGLTGEGALNFPVFEGAGNHDRNKNWFVREQVAKRHGGRFYSFDWGDLRLVCLDEGPDDSGFEVLTEALAGVERDVPLILYFHYPLLGPYSDDQWFGRGDFRQRLARVIRGRRVLGLFHGHYHATGAYRWEGFDVYNVGSPKHRHTSFTVVEVKDDRMQVAAYDYLHHKWIWWHRKPLGPTGPKELIGVAPDLEPELVPDFTLDLEPRTP